MREFKLALKIGAILWAAFFLFVAWDSYVHWKSGDNSDCPRHDTCHEDDDAYVPMFAIGAVVPLALWGVIHAGGRVVRRLRRAQDPSPTHSLPSS